jgi:hypothetical protein
MRASAPAILQCVKTHGAAKFKPGTQISVLVSWLSTGNVRLDVSWNAKAPTGPLPALATCVENVGLGWQIAESSRKRAHVLFNLS